MSLVVMIMLIFSLLQLGSGQWQVIGPDKPVHVREGEDTIFTCFLLPETNAEAMEVRFFKDQFSGVVHLYRDGKDQKYMQLPAYQGRTVLMKGSIVDGRVSLKLKKVTSSDAGLYGCWFSSQTYDQKATWELQVSALNSAPLISVMGFVDGGIQLLCQSSGWLSQPTVKWKDSLGHDLSSHSKVTADRHSPFDVESSFIVQENVGSISCSIQHPDLSQEMESRVWIRETFFQPSPWRLAFILLGLICFILSVGIIAMRISFPKYQGKVLAELEWRRKQIQAELREYQKYTVEVTLDPDTAHPQLYISDLNTITYKEDFQSVTYTEKRFKKECVVASQGFHSGKHYWEVDVGDNENWFLGVCQDDVPRKKTFFSISIKMGYWVLTKKEDNMFFIFNPHKSQIFPCTPVTRVGIFLDYEGGIISFFNVNNQSFIYTLTSQFKGLLRPFIMLQPQKNKNMTPIVINPVSQRSERKASFQMTPTPPNTNQEPLAQVTTPLHSKNNPQRESYRTLSFRLLRFLSGFQSLPADSSDGF